MDITLQGTLHSFHISEVLTFLNMGEKTGTLNLSTGSTVVDIYIQKGNVVYAKSNQERMRLSALLLRKERIDEECWRRIEQLMRTQQEKFGRVAVEQKILTEAELGDFLKIQASEIIYDCFVWDSGRFSFTDARELPPHAITIAIDHKNLIMEGARRINEMEYITQNLPPNDSVLNLISDPATQESMQLTLEEWKILFLIDGKRTLEDISNESSSDRLEVYRFLYGLLANKMVEVLQVVSQPETHTEGNRHVTAIADPTIPSDTGLLVSATARFTYKDVLKITLARLTLKKTDTEKETFPLIEQEYYIGRQMGNQIHLTDPSISNVHARIFKGPEGYVLEDMNSRNGTFVNGVRIDRKLLHENDAVRLGNSNFVYNIVYEVKRHPNTSMP